MSETQIPRCVAVLLILGIGVFYFATLREAKHARFHAIQDAKESNAKNNPGFVPLTAPQS